MTDYMTIPEAAVRWQSAPCTVRKECELHQICGAVRFGRSWLIPADAQKPEYESRLTVSALPEDEARYQARLRANRGEL